jgi:type III restriction enzyme
LFFGESAFPSWAPLVKAEAILSSYDWSEKPRQVRLYFVVETKSTLFADAIRDTERAKIECGKAHFKALAVGEMPAEYRVARTVDELLTAAKD